MTAPSDQLRQSDCIEGMNSLPEGSVDLVFADPPFNIGYEYDVYVDSLDYAAYIKWSRRWLTAVHRVLKSDGTFWLAIGDEHAAELKLECQKLGFRCRSWVIWYYTFGVNCSNKFTRSHAHLLYFVKNPAQFIFNSEKPENRVQSARQLVYGDARANPKGRLPDDTWLIRPASTAGEMVDDDSEWSLCGITPQTDSDQTYVLRPQDLSDSFKPEENTWYFPRVAGTFKERAGFHGCQMPEQLLGRIIRSCSNEGDLVLDPFSGSATTLVVAKKLGRRYMGFDISSDYVAYGTKRLNSVYVGDPLEGSSEPLLSAPKTQSSKEGRTSRLRPAADDRRAIDGWNSDNQLALTRRGILEAYAQSYRGYSPDRVVADPDLNAHFVDQCQRLGLLGNARVWNTLLFGLRKAGKLVDFPTTERTLISWEDCDNFLFASEIAFEAMLQQSASSLDEILCDPSLAVRFDELAARFAPGYCPLEYRWGALKLRKQAKLARSRGSILKVPSKLHSPILLDGLNQNGLSQIEELSDAPGIYLVTGDGGKALYVGETVSLKKRLLKNFDSPQPLRAWMVHGEANVLSIETYVTYSTSSQMLAWQSCLMRKYATRFNFRELRVAE
jgi:site-specific DNA-methyltransferase (adenine-specific)